MKRTFSLIALLTMLSACTYSGLPGDLALSELTEEQSQQLCNATQDYLDDNLSAQDRKTFGCNLRGTLAGSFVDEDAYAETCTDTQTTCLAEEDQQEDTGDATNCGGVGVSNCTATVEQYEACTRELIDNIKESNASFSCEDGPTPDDQQDDEEIACADYQKICSGT